MLIMQSCRRPGGFTLIELMMTLVIAGIVFALGVPAIGTWMQNAQVRTVAESIQNGLQIARNEALHRNVRVEFVMNTDTSWTVTAKVPDPATDTIKDVIVQQRPAAEGSSSKIAVVITGNDTASFNGLGRIDNAGPLTRVDVSSSSGTKKLAVQIANGGEIRLCDPLVTDDKDPRRCL
jgi:type IV fimbrial biogenesis protein FimT